jgi:adenine-specific DNA-methyltransferase
MSLEKLDLASPNLVNENIEKIAALFPNCVTEGSEGKVIDFDLLKQELSDSIVEGNKERYRLEWPGKREAIVTANLPTTKTLRPVREDSVDFDNTENLYIEGDNLEVLKLLQESYLGKVKMIYIDPPYNTGKDFVYKDNFTEDSKEHQEESGQRDEYGRRLVVNPETSGRFHSDWLSMMYPRLKLARNLLTNDGAVFISCDESEQPRVRQICDEIFGQANFVADMIWAAGRKNDSKLISVSHEYIISYAKDKDLLRQEKVIWRQKKKGLDDIYKAVKRFNAEFGNDYKEITKSLKTWYKSLSDGHPSKAHKHYNNIDKNGVYFPADISWPGGGGPKYEVLHPTTGKPVKVPSRGWITPDKEKMKIWIKEERVHFGEDEKNVPCLKKYLVDSEEQTPYSVFYQDGRAASKRLRTLMDGNIFDFPKDESVLAEIIEMLTESGDIILDFFAGSSTSAHSVMNLNSRENKNLQFIQVQLPEKTDEKSEAYKSGFKNICEIGKERIRRAGKKIKEETKADIDYGFRVFRLDESNMQDVYYKPHEYSQDNLELFADNVKPDRSSDDLLTQVMIDWGLPLSLKIEQVEITGKEVFKVAENSLYACFDEDLDEEFAKAIADDAPLRIVFKDSGFKDDTAKTNVKQLLKQLSPETEMKVI